MLSSGPLRPARIVLSRPCDDALGSRSSSPAPSFRRRPCDKRGAGRVPHGATCGDRPGCPHPRSAEGLASISVDLLPPLLCHCHERVAGGAAPAARGTARPRTAHRRAHARRTRRASRAPRARPPRAPPAAPRRAAAPRSARAKSHRHCSRRQPRFRAEARHQQARPLCKVREWGRSAGETTGVADGARGWRASQM